jgi:hypothetical protein
MRSPDLPMRETTRIAQALPSQGRVLRLPFASQEAFRQEFERNIAKGGAFVEGVEFGELREMVTVELELGFCGERIRIPAEVVAGVPAELAGAGVKPGVAVQFDLPVRELRSRLGPLAQVSVLPEEQPEALVRRGAPRYESDVAVRVSVGGRWIPGRARNLSRTGALVAVEGEAPRVGSDVRIGFTHPGTGQEFVATCHVARELPGDGVRRALGIQFPEQEAEFLGFIEEVQASEHAQRLGGISGPLEELALEDLLQMFGSSSRSGTLVLTRGEEQGRMVFENGLLTSVCAGAASGMKALVRLLSWQEGSFQFRGEVEAAETDEPPITVAGALLDAARLVDELRKVDPSRFPAGARLRVDAGRLAAEESKLETAELALLDLATAGFTLADALDVIPAPDPEIYAALHSLVERGVVLLEG